MAIYDLLPKFGYIEPNLLKGLQPGFVVAQMPVAETAVATLTKEDIRKIAEIKMPDLNAYDIDAAIRIVAGTARNMGIAVKGLNDAEMAEQVKEAKEAEAQAAKLEAELEEMEESAKAMAEGAGVEVESTEQSKEEETESEE